MSLEIRNLTSNTEIMQNNFVEFWDKVESDEYSKRPIFCIEDKINFQAWSNFWHEHWFECPVCHKKTEKL